MNVLIAELIATTSKFRIEEAWLPDLADVDALQAAIAVYCKWQELGAPAADEGRSASDP